MVDTFLAIAGVVAGGLAAFFSFSSYQLKMSGKPVIDRFFAYKRKNFTAITFTIYPGDYSVNITKIQVPGHRIAWAYRENGIPSGSQPHLWDRPPEDNFADVLPCKIRITPRNEPHEVLISLPDCTVGDIEVVCSSTCWLPRIRGVTHVRD